MKLLSYLFILGTLSGVLSACDQNSPEEEAAKAPEPEQTEEPAPAPAPGPAPGTTKSEYFETVAAHLDTGGTFFGYVDVAGDLDRLLETAQKVFDTVREKSGEDIPEIDIKALVSELGLQSVSAMGGSSLPISEGRYRNQAFIHTPDGAEGLLTLLGTEAKPFATLERAPEATDIIVEQEIRLAPLKAIALGIYEQLPKDQGIPPIDQMMKQPLPGAGMTLEEVLDQANGRALFMAKFDPEKTVGLPVGPQPVEIPAIDFLLDLQGFGWLFERFQGMLPQEGPFQRELGEGFTKITMQIPPEVPFSFYQPVLLHDQEANRLVLASRAEYLDACEAGTGVKITEDADFQNVFAGMPTEGNAFTYLSPRVKPVLTTAVREAMEREGAPEAMGKLVDMVLGNLETLASVTVNKPNGIHSIANSATSFKSGLISGALAPAAIGAFAVGSYQRTRIVAQPPPGVRVDDVAEEVVADAAAQMAGMEQVVAALRLYAVANNGQFPDNLADLVPDHLDEQAAETALTWQTRNGPAALVYFSGLTVASAENPIILASPEPDNNGQRAVAHIDGTTETVSEDDFFKLARAALEQAN